MLNASKSSSTFLIRLGLGVASLVSMLAVGLGNDPARADVPLTRADVESILNRVEFIPRGRTARNARISDFLAVGDALRTAAASRAELRFNDGSLARVGEQATFRFVPNTRNFRLSDGTMLLLIPSGRGRSTIQTPSAITGIQGSAVVVRYIENRNLTVVMALTNNPDGPMTVTSGNCTDANASLDASNCASTEYALYAGQMALVQDNRVQVLEFDLPMFYQTSPLLEGLELDNPDADVPLGSSLESVRTETLEALNETSPLTNATVLNPALLSIDSTNQTASVEPWLLAPTGSRSVFIPAGALTNPTVDTALVGETPQPVRPIDTARPIDTVETPDPGPITTPDPLPEPGPITTPDPLPEPGPITTPDPLPEPGPITTPDPLPEPGPITTPDPLPEPGPITGGGGGTTDPGPITGGGGGTTDPGPITGGGGGTTDPGPITGGDPGIGNPDLPVNSPDGFVPPEKN